MKTNEAFHIIKGVKAGYEYAVYAKVKIKKYGPKEPIIIQKRFLDSILKYNDLQNKYLEIGIAKDPKHNALLFCIRKYPAKNKDIWYAIAEYMRD
jgi:hypothetical protein